MQKKIFYNDISTEKNLEIKTTVYKHHTNKKINVNINQLLNRVKVAKRGEKKEKIIFLSLAILIVGTTALLSI
jgi:hypothetical protein|tara:strand:+ start:1327 stop:1545 length:219 start_codon:yes stop_codon:yes gene_type:complete